MPYIYLPAAITFSAMLAVMTAVFNRRNHAPHISNLYNILYMAASFLCWTGMYITDFSFDPRVLWYSAAYGLFYALALFGLFHAIQCGSVSLTSFIKQLSFVGVAVWGFVFWHSPITFTITVALLLIALSLYLCFRTDKGAAKSPISAKWVLYVSLLFVGNAGCSIVQKYQQMAFDGQHGTMLMCFAVAFAMLLVGVFLFKNGVPSFKQLAKGSLKFPLFAGISSALANLFILFLANSTLSPAVIYPCIAVGGMILSILFSVVVYKERLAKAQWIGLGIGVVAIVFLNL